MVKIIITFISLILFCFVLVFLAERLVDNTDGLKQQHFENKMAKGGATKEEIHKAIDEMEKEKQGWKN